ncbi:MAG: hypothetical protein C4527_10635 [Candidatus Omnitrophota bacterium]|jgi:hypothetical protein|nr:MAG: hypothetical protein C4527_10635 [Candidatus Omnitrophota bacterium]
MQPYKDKLKTLQKMLISEDNFNITFKYFFEQLGEDPSFIESSKKVKNPFLKSILKAIGKQIFNEEDAVAHLMLLKLPKSSFYHGSCFIHGRMASIIYFEDIEMGMVAIYLGGASGNEMRLVRYSSTLIEGNQLAHKPFLPTKTLH